jgi:hypothetical protein
MILYWRISQELTILIPHSLPIDHLKNPFKVAKGCKCTPHHAATIAGRIAFFFAMLNTAVVPSENNTRTARSFQA